MAKSRPVFKKVFESDEDFMASHAAEAWVRERGYSVGSRQRGAPTAIYKGDCDVAKWRNLSRQEQQQADGLMTTADPSYRKGPVTVELFGISEEPAPMTA